MPRPSHNQLARRERQIMEIVSLAAVTPSVRAASRGESAPVVGVAASAAYTQVAVAPVAPASEPPASSTAPREGRRQPPEPDAVQTTLERAHAEPRELQRALEARTRELEIGSPVAGGPARPRRR